MAKDWDIIITNKSNLLSIDLQEIWHYRDLLSMYVKRDIITFYKQTILGSLWLIFQPLFTNNYVHVCVWWHCRNLYLYDSLHANMVREMVDSHKKAHLSSCRLTSTKRIPILVIFMPVTVD